MLLNVPFLFLPPPGLGWNTPCTSSSACLTPPQSSGSDAGLIFLCNLGLLFSEDCSPHHRHPPRPPPPKSFFRKHNCFSLPLTRHFCLKFKVIPTVPLCVHLSSSQVGSGVLTVPCLLRRLAHTVLPAASLLLPPLLCPPVRGTL